MSDNTHKFKFSTVLGKSGENICNISGPYDTSFNINFTGVYHSVNPGVTDVYVNLPNSLTEKKTTGMTHIYNQKHLNDILFKRNGFVNSLASIKSFTITTKDKTTTIPVIKQGYINSEYLNFINESIKEKLGIDTYITDTSSSIEIVNVTPDSSFEINIDDHKFTCDHSKKINIPYYVLVNPGSGIDQMVTCLQIDGQPGIPPSAIENEITKMIQILSTTYIKSHKKPLVHRYNKDESFGVIIIKEPIVKAVCSLIKKVCPTATNVYLNVTKDTSQANITSSPVFDISNYMKIDPSMFGCKETSSSITSKVGRVGSSEANLIAMLVQQVGGSVKKSNGELKINVTPQQMQQIDSLMNEMKPVTDGETAGGAAAAPAEPPATPSATQPDAEERRKACAAAAEKRFS